MSHDKRRRDHQKHVGLLNLAPQLGNISEAWKVMRFSRDNFYRVKHLYETSEETALQEINRKKPILKNRVTPEIEEAMVRLSIEYPT